jgi:transposase
MTKQNRRKFTSEFKTKVVLEALKERSTIEQLAKRYDVHPTQINNWKREFLTKASVVFSEKHDNLQKQQEADTEKLYAQIGQLKVENDFLKKKLM